MLEVGGAAAAAGGGRVRASALPSIVKRHETADKASERERRRVDEPNRKGDSNWPGE